MNKQIFYLLVLFFAFSISSTAQNLYVHLNSGVTNTYPTSDVKKITFSGTDMNLIKTDGSTLTWAISDVKKYTYSTTVGIEEKDILSSSNTVVYPNPSTGKFKIDYTLNQDDEISISLYQMNGTLVETYISEKQFQGQHTIDCENSNLGAGTYLIKFQSRNNILVKKLIITK